MFKNRYDIIKKGYVLIYTLILGLITIMIAVFCFSLVMQEQKYNKSYQGYVKSNICYQNYKELLLSQVNNQLKKSVADKTTENIKNYLRMNTIEFRSFDGKSNISYNTSSELLILESYIDTYLYREDSFDITMDNGTITFVYKSTNYIKGRMN